MSLTIIGFGKVTFKDLGKVGSEQTCVWCSARVVYHLVLVRKWFTYFFIPVIPYRRVYMAGCPECGEGILISDKEAEAARRGELTLRRA